MSNNRYLASILSIVITLVAAFATTTSFSWPIIVQLAILTVTSITTYLLPIVNRKWQGAWKTGLEIVGAILTAVTPFVIAGHITGAEVAVVALAALKALGTELGVAARVASDVLPEQPLPVQPDPAPVEADSTSQADPAASPDALAPQAEPALTATA